jgi:hypothetical protein
VKRRANGWTDQAYEFARMYVLKLTPNPQELWAVLDAAVETAGTRTAWPHRAQERATWAIRAAAERFREARDEPSVANILNYQAECAKAKGLVDAVLRCAVGAR